MKNKKPIHKAYYKIYKETLDKYRKFKEILMINTINIKTLKFTMRSFYDFWYSVDKDDPKKELLLPTKVYLSDKLSKLKKENVKLNDILLEYKTFLKNISIELSKS